MLNGVAAGTVFALGDVPAVVGRSPEAHLQIGDPWISSMHAMFERRDDGTWVVDLESRNGTFVGDERVGEARVPDGAVVRLGKTEVRVSAGGAVAGEAPRAPDAPGSQPVSRRETVRADATASLRGPPAREAEAADPYALALRRATVLRMAVDAAGLEGLPGAGERLQAALDAATRAALDAGAVAGRLPGVGVLAVFGLVAPAPEDAVRALAAARAARQVVRDGGGLDLRAAIETGPVLTGNAAGAGGLELAALGPAGERAERLLAVATPGEILAGPGAAEATGLPRDGLRRVGDVELEVFADRGE